jgi:hypothetical protein
MMLRPEELEGVDFNIFRLIVHKSGAFYSKSTPDIDQRWR